MNQAETYKQAVYEDGDYCEINPVWKRYYGSAGEYCRRTGSRQSKAMYLGFADGSRIRVTRGGSVEVV